MTQFDYLYRFIILLILLPTLALGQTKWGKRIELKGDNVFVNIRTKQIVSKRNLSKPVSNIQFNSKSRTALTIMVQDIPLELLSLLKRDDVEQQQALVKYARNQYKHDSSYVVFDTLQQGKLNNRYPFVDFAYISLDKTPLNDLLLSHNPPKPFKKSEKQYQEAKLRHEAILAKEIQHYSYEYKRFLLVNNNLYCFSSNNSTFERNSNDALHARDILLTDFERLVCSICIKETDKPK